MRKALIAALLLAAVPTLASAQDMRREGDRACKGDARRLCRAVLNQGDGAILGCFQRNQRRLSGRCYGFLRRIGQIY